MKRPDGPWPTAGTRLVVLLGWPVAHSLSPVMHNAAFREQDLDLAYVALPTPSARLGTVVETLGAVGAVGANVTVPHKQAIVALCDRLTDEAALIGAVNTLTWSPDGVVGDNTDAAGLGGVLTDLAVDHEWDVVVLGTGGAARAVAVATGRIGAALTVVGRRPSAAQQLADLATAAGSRETDAVDLADTDWVRAAVRSARLVVNATPLGMDGEDLPSPFHALAPDQVAYDLIYNPPETPFLRDARAAGADAHHGLGMLVGQAAAAYQRWTGQQAPVGVMSAAATSALATSHT